MQSFHQSRARIAFEALCALGMSGSLAGAWMQTYAPAFIPAAGIAALYGLARASDMFRRTSHVAAKTEPAAQPAPVVSSDSVIRSWPLPAAAIADPTPVEPAQAKAPAKKRRPSKAAKPVKQPEVARIVPEPPIAEVPDAEHGPIAPLFEPEPFVRQQQRAAFGRKAG